MEPITVRMLPIALLQPAEYNPRRELKPTDRAYRRLKRSIEEFGLVEPLVWNERTGKLVGGHLRLRILDELHYAEVPVTVVQLTDAREKALNIILNNREAQGRFDPVKLRDLLQELEPLGELPPTGFEPSDLAALELKPVESLLEESSPQHVEVLLRMTPETYAQAGAALDRVIQEFDLEAHVRGG